MKKKLIALILIIMTLLFVTSCEQKEEKAQTAYFNFFGTRYDLCDRTDFAGCSSAYGRLGVDEIVARTFSEEADFVKDNESYVIVRLKCTGDMTQRIYDKEHYDSEKMHEYDSFSSFESIKLYTETPFAVLDILEGNENLLKVGDSIFVHTYLMYMDYAMYESHEKWKNYDYSSEEISKPVFELWCPDGRVSVLPRVGYEYVLILKYNEQCGSFTSTLRKNQGCELSSTKDYAEFITRLSGVDSIPEDIKYDDCLPDAYWEILERYNIEIE
jgi:hypothetical protein